jgi:hypothetical protein
MMLETRMDELIHRLDHFNRLLDLRGPTMEAGSEEDEEKGEGKKSGKKGGKKGGGFFGTVVGEILFRVNRDARPGIVGITHPSDGHPQEELTPDFGWFRPLAHNNATWTLYWPELII